MFNTNAGPSLADIAAVTGNNNDAFGGNNGWWILIILFAIFGGWGNGYGNNGNAGAQDNYVLASDFATLQRQIDTSADGLRQQSTGIANGLCDGFYTQAQLVNGLDKSINAASTGILGAINADTIANMQNTNAIGAQLTGLSTQLAQCCCDNKYQLAEQSCQTRQAIADATAAITLNQDANTRNILTAIQDMQTQALQDKIAMLTADNQSLKFAASQQAQNAYLLHELKTPPVPAYQVPNPFTGQMGYGTGCGC